MAVELRAAIAIRALEYGSSVMVHAGKMQESYADRVK